jgi:hypothetical protein
MVRHLSRILLGLVCLSTCSIFLPGYASAQAPTSAFGQGGIFNDPFTFYYAFYLPNQQLTAMRPTPNDSINAAVVARQYYAAADRDRRSLYNPVSPYAEGTYDPLRPYSQQGQERLARRFSFSVDPSNADGSGPSLYFNRAQMYFPHLREARGANANVAPVRRGAGIGRPGRGGVGGMGMGGMGGMGMPGMGGMGMPGMGMPGMGGMM